MKRTSHDLDELLAIDAAALADIEAGAVRLPLHGSTWLDVRPLLDLRERSGEAIDLARIAIDHALERDLIERHPVTAYLVRIVRRAGDIHQAGA